MRRLLFGLLLMASSLFWLTPINRCLADDHASQVTPSNYFYSDFSDSKSLLDWNQQLNGGSVTSTPTSILLQGTPQTGLAGLTLQPNHFPDGDWTATICFRYTDNKAGFGSGVGFLDADGKWVARIWSKWLVQVNTDVVTGVSGPTFQDTNGDTDWHMYSVERKGVRLETFVDGRDIGGCNFAGTMGSVFLGGGAQQSCPDNWCQSEIRFVKIERGADALVLADSDSSYPKTPLAQKTVAPAINASAPLPPKIQAANATTILPKIPGAITLHLPKAPPAPQQIDVPYYVPVYVPYEPLYDPLSWTYTETRTYYGF